MVRAVEYGPAATVVGVQLELPRFRGPDTPQLPGPGSRPAEFGEDGDGVGVGLGQAAGHDVGFGEPAQPLPTLRRAPAARQGQVEIAVRQPTLEDVDAHVPTPVGRVSAGPDRSLRC